jgi:hypothetical protein
MATLESTSTDFDLRNASFSQKNEVLLGSVKANLPVKTIVKTNNPGCHSKDERKRKLNEIKWKASRKKTIHTKALMRKRNGLVISNGFVLQGTNVLFNTVKGMNLKDHPFFHDIPQKCIRGFPMTKVDELRALEIELDAFAEKKVEWHRYGANGGVNLGISVTDGGAHGNKECGYSGGIHCGFTLKSQPDLRRRVHSLIKSILDEAYGKVLWYRRMVHLCDRLNKESGEERTIPGTPLSGIWWATVTKKDAVHCDQNIVGPIFVLSTFEAKRGSASLCFLSDSGRRTQFTLQPGKIMGGRWGSNPHFNRNMDPNAQACRMSWTLYLDKRVFGNNYKFVYPQEYLE